MPLFGVTVTDPWVADGADAGELGGALDGLSGQDGRPPVVRVVFDEGVDQVFDLYGIDASAYVAPVENIGEHASVMGELLDSFYMRRYSVEQYRARACEYRSRLGHLVDIWEIGNEVNGEWLGDGVIDKLVAATQVFTADEGAFNELCGPFGLRPDERDFELALTLYYNGPYAAGVPTAESCWSDAGHAMMRWVEQNLAREGWPGADQIRPHLDYVWISYYEDDCEGIQPVWGPIFDDLGSVFEDAALGFGECGTTRIGRKVSYVRRYYVGMDSDDPDLANMAVSNPRYVGGLFWWYFSDDMGNPEVYGELQGALDSPFWVP
ncbi:MAG TPA: hypothetical protein ENK57_05370 [Polyangiaceae bacterium]|nr:hypothetical protein [Polyangiaceae bacterium]